MLFNTPLSPEKADRLIKILDLSPNGRVLDVGCGTGEFLIRVIQATGVQGLGIDNNTTSIAATREQAAARIPAASVEFREADIKQVPLEAGSFDAAICLGSTHAFGPGKTAYPKALERLSHLVRPGGQILIGEGYWKQPPAPDYLQLLGEPVGIYHDHAGNVAFAEQYGLVPLYATVSNEDEWDHFEWSHRLKIEREVLPKPVDTAAAKKLARSRAWRDGYLRWGRNTMGFGFYLFLKPPNMA